MDYKVLLLTLVLAVVTEGQSTTSTTPSTLTSKADQETTRANQETTRANQETTRAADDSSETESTEDDLKPEESSDRFTFTQADALKPKKLTFSTKPDNDLATEGDDEDPMEELTIFEKLLSDSEKQNDDDETDDKVKDHKIEADDDDSDDNDEADDKAKDLKIAAGDNDNDDDDEEGDDDSDEDGESNPKSSSGTAELVVPKPEGIQIRRQGNLRPGFGLDSSNVENSRPTQDNNKPDPSAAAYLPARDQASTSDASSDSSPLLQLTQGGYQRPYQRLLRLNDQRQRMRSGSASQQSETLETPRVSGVNENQPGQLVPQVEYTAPYQPQLNLGAYPVEHPVFQHPPGGLGGNRILSDGLQNGFFNTPPAGFTDFTSANYHSQFHPADNGGFSAVPRDQGGFSMFQTSPRQNPGLLFQGTPQYPQAHPTFDNYPRPAQTLFHPGSYSNFPNLDIVEDTPRPNYSPFMRHPAMNSQFQVNPNFYGTSPNSGVNDFNNPGINLLPNYPSNGERQSFQPQLFRYPMPDSQITLQSSDQVEKQKQGSAGPVEELKTKYSDGMKVSQDKEDPTSVPFGSRIRQNNVPDQNAFSGQRDVYLRYPVREAGYATEENLPVQNTTEETTGNTAPSSSNPPFPFYTSPDELRSFSSSDPYRNALNVLQQSFVNDKRNADDTNQTGGFPVDQYVRNAPVQFDDRLIRPPQQLFSPYQRNQEVPVFQNRPLYPVPGLDGARNPFYQLPGVLENRNLFAPQGNGEDPNSIPVCAQNNNGSVCFKDTDYPKRELLYALNSNSFLMRLSSPNQIVEKVTLEAEKKLDNSDSEDNYICKSDVKYGLPLRAKNVQETWNVIVNLEDSQFIQPVRLDICRAASQPCSFTQVKTACVQKYTLQRLLSWSPDKGLFTDVYKLPVACSCQIVDAKA